MGWALLLGESNSRDGRQALEQEVSFNPCGCLAEEGKGCTCAKRRAEFSKKNPAQVVCKIRYGGLGTKGARGWS